MVDNPLAPKPEFALFKLLVEHLTPLCVARVSLEDRLSAKSAGSRADLVQILFMDGNPDVAKITAGALEHAFGEGHDKETCESVVVSVLSLPELSLEYDRRTDALAKTVHRHARTSKVLYLLRPASSCENDLRAFFKQRRSANFPSHELVAQVEIFLRAWHDEAKKILSANAV